MICRKSRLPDELLRSLVLDGILEPLGALVVAPAEELGAQPEISRFSPQQQVQRDLPHKKNAQNGAYCTMIG